MSRTVTCTDQDATAAAIEGFKAARAEGRAEVGRMFEPDLDAIQPEGDGSGEPG